MYKLRSKLAQVNADPKAFAAQPSFKQGNHIGLAVLFECNVCVLAVAASLETIAKEVYRHNRFRVKLTSIYNHDEAVKVCS